MYTIVDVREPSEYNSGHIEGAINLPPKDLQMGAPQLADIPKDTKLLLYCVSGARSSASIHILREMGYTDLHNGISKARVQKMIDGKLI